MLETFGVNVLNYKTYILNFIYLESFAWSSVTEMTFAGLTVLL